MPLAPAKVLMQWKIHFYIPCSQHAGWFSFLRNNPSKVRSKLNLGTWWLLPVLSLTFHDIFKLLGNRISLKKKQVAWSKLTSWKVVSSFPHSFKCSLKFIYTNMNLSFAAFAECVLQIGFEFFQFGSVSLVISMLVKSGH